MQDRFLREYFNRRRGSSLDPGDNERRRVVATQAMIPPEWRSVIDVGCGDGRATHSLLDRQVDLYGIDWASRRLARFGGKAIIADIRASWPMHVVFDGAVLAEVLEHLSPAEIRAVLSNVRRFVKHGWVASVPAHESLLVNSVTCQACKQDYHIWGHRHSFQSFDQVDELVGQVAVARRFVRFDGAPRSSRIARIRRAFGFYPYEPGLVCPFCGAELPPPPRSNLPTNLISKALTVVELASTSRGPAPGWFICRYPVE
jgi:SAM-dependent methyltransferase